MKSSVSFLVTMLLGSFAYADGINVRLSVPKKIYGPGNQISRDFGR